MAYKNHIRKTPISKGKQPKAAAPVEKKKPKSPPLELHACMGLNACKGHGVFGENECAGQGNCATQWHGCHTLNNCRGQGGCGLYGTTEEQCKPGANDCAWQGSCGTPIVNSRFITQGPNKGKSVWILARRLFEERMKKANRNVGKSPLPHGPTLEFLDTIESGSYELGYSCGFSGNKGCSFVSPKEAKKRVAKFEKESEAYKYKCEDEKKKKKLKMKPKLKAKLKAKLKKAKK